MDIFFLTAFVAVVAALVERNHRRASVMPRAPWGAAQDRDLQRVIHDLPDAPVAGRRPLRPHLPVRHGTGTREAATC